MNRIRKIALVVLTFTLALAVTLSSTDALQRSAASDLRVDGTPVSLSEQASSAQHSLTEADSTAGKKTKTIEKKAPTADVLWLARAIYSETKRPLEEELVGWVIRNRVETGYRGKHSYKSVVLDPYQFSAFNPGTRTRREITSMTLKTGDSKFKAAVGIASKVVAADVSDRPFSKYTRHFYSARSMAGGRKPAWAHNRRPVKLDVPVSANRFRFYSRVS